MADQGSYYVPEQSKLPFLLPWAWELWDLVQLLGL